MPGNLTILFEDNHLIAVNKSNHDLVQMDNTGDLALEDRLKIYIKKKYKKPGNVFLGVTHRLDRPVSGVVLFARTTKALTRINELFRNDKIQKTYWAIVKNKPGNDENILVHYLLRDARQNKTYCYEREMVNSKRAELRYRLVASSNPSPTGSYWLSRKR